MTVILALDTCLAACAVSVRSGTRVWTRSEVIERGHAERAAPMVRDVLDEAGVSARDLTRLCVTVGPGSFMGVRVGLSLAKGLALPRDVPCVGVTTLETIALSAPGRPVLIGAGRGQAYALPPGGRAALVTADEARALALTGRPVGVRLATLGVTGDEVFPDTALMAEHAETAQPGPLRPVYLRAPDAKPARPSL